MAARKPRFSVDAVFGIAVILSYIIGQVVIGSYDPGDGRLHFDAPSDLDFLYYAGIIEQMKHDFPPQNPAYGGVPLSQSFVQYYPTAAAALVVNPYLAMRILNLVYVLLLAMVLRRYFLRGWGVGLAMTAAGSVGFGLINALSVDLVARGFNHFPFFIAFVIALFEERNEWLRYGALFLLGWLHSFLALQALLLYGGLVLFDRFSRRRIVDALICLAGVVSAASITLGVADKPFYFPFVEGFRFDVTDLWMHAVAPLALAAAARNVRIIMLTAVAVLFGMFFHYNPFFPVFMLYFAAGWAGMELFAQGGYRFVVTAVACALFVGFVFSAVGKYNPGKGNFVPFTNDPYFAAGRWLEANSAPGAVLLTAPLESDKQCRLIETRAVYLGFIPHVAHLGIDWRVRAQKILSYYRQPAVYMAEIDYIVYGPVERKLFPDFRLGGDPIFRDASVTIWKSQR
jgi:hypothetical protein